MRTKLGKIIVPILISVLLNKFAISCKENNTGLKMIRGKQVQIDSNLSANKEIENQIAPYKDKLTGKINEVLCFNPRALSRHESALESSLGNFYADACFKIGDSLFWADKEKHVDFALFNYGGIRTALPQGDIAVEHVFKLMPFENKLVIVSLEGKKVSELFQYLQQSQSAHPISGLSLVMEQDSITTVRIGKQAFDPNRIYHVVTHDYLQKGGDNMSFFRDPVDLYVSDIKIRDALINSLRPLDTLRAQLDNRFVKTN